MDIFLSFLNSDFLGEDKLICVRCFEIIGEYFAAARTRSGAFLEQIITTSKLVFQYHIYRTGPTLSKSHKCVDLGRIHSNLHAE